MAVDDHTGVCHLQKSVGGVKGAYGYMSECPEVVRRV